MPNYCYNTLIVDKDIADKLIHKNENGILVLDFNDIVPMPAHQPDLDKPNPFFRTGSLGFEEREKFGENNWYDWSVVHWGTKWNAMDLSVGYIDNKAYLAFSTAWSPPEPIAAALSVTYPKKRIRLEFEEEGMGFKGYVIYQNGQKINDVELDWQLTHAICPVCNEGYGEVLHATDEEIIRECQECNTQWKATPTELKILSKKEHIGGTP